MLIAQITDVHLGFEPGNEDELNRRRLDTALAALRGCSPAPDLLLVTGDLTEGGARESYEQLREALHGLPFPVHLAIGNHDRRDAFGAVFPDVPTSGGFVHYAVEDHPLRLLILDTVEEGRHGGAFCEVRAAWLTARLDEAPERPTLIVLHHPPAPTGLSWMTEDADAPWIRRLRACIEGRANVAGLVCGHLHRPVVTAWAGTILAICPSTAPQVALDFAPIDPETPDNRPMIVAGPPAYALHHWDGRALVTHFAAADDAPVLARFTPKLQPLLRRLAHEKKQASHPAR